MKDNLFYQMFTTASKYSLEDFDDNDLKDEGIEVPELTENDIAREGYVTAIAGDIVRDFSDAYKEIKGWFLKVESKRKYINELCDDTIDWLREEDRNNPKLSLDVNRLKTWMKTSETFYWRYYFILSDSIFNDIMTSIKKNEITKLEIYVDLNTEDRTKVTRMLDSANEIKDLILIVQKYKARCNLIFEGLLKRKRRIQSFPFQIMLLGQADLNRTVKKIVNLAT